MARPVPGCCGVRSQSGGAVPMEQRELFLQITLGCGRAWLRLGLARAFSAVPAVFSCPPPGSVGCWDCPEHTAPAITCLSLWEGRHKATGSHFSRCLYLVAKAPFTPSASSFPSPADQTLFSLCKYWQASSSLPEGKQSGEAVPSSQGRHSSLTPPQPPLGGQLSAQHGPGSSATSFIPNNTQPFTWLHPKGLCLGLEAAVGAQPLQVGLSPVQVEVFGRAG